MMTRCLLGEPLIHAVPDTGRNRREWLPQPRRRDMSTGTYAVAEQSAYALLADGTTILIRPARQEDYKAVRDMHAAMSADDLYLRFFTVSKLAPDQEAR